MSPGIPRPDGAPPKGALTFVRQVLALGSWDGDFEPTTSFSVSGARAMSRLVLAHPAVADGARPDAPLALFELDRAIPASTGSAPTRSATSSREPSRSA